MGKGRRIFFPPCNKSAAITAFLSIFFLPASTPLGCWLISANRRASDMSAAMLNALIGFISAACVLSLSVANELRVFYLRCVVAEL